jgi:hypothetical protein
MLLQSHEGVLRLFPVWEKGKDAAFRSLRAYGAFLVSARQENGETRDVTVYSEKGRPCTVQCPWAAGMTVFADGAPVDCRVQRAGETVFYTFETESGKEYRLQPQLDG